MRSLCRSIFALLGAGLLVGSIPGCDAGTSSQLSASAAAPLSRSVMAAPIHRQVIQVITADWDQAQGKLRRWQWQAGAWQLVGEPIPVLIGKRGLAWGIGLADYRTLPGPTKHEGDLKSPAGIFALGTAFGYAPEDSASFLRVPYVHVSETLMCIEDTSSRAYNRIVDEARTQADWSSTDHMRRQDERYQWGMMVHHNYESPLPGGGSCIFLHGWRKGGAGTAGCTSLDKHRLRALLSWLDPEQLPVLVQAPASLYPALTSNQNWPPLP